MHRLFIPAVAALALTTTHAAAQPTLGVNALSALNDGAYSFGTQLQYNVAVASLDLGHIKHEVPDPAHQRDRLQVIGLGAQLGPVVLSGHYGQAVCAHTLDVFGASLWYEWFGVRVLRFEGDTRIQAGFRLPLLGGDGGSMSSARRSWRDRLLAKVR